MSRMIKVADWAGPQRASVVFVHGLSGHAYDTWRCAADDGTFWPRWLAEDVEGATVYTLAYNAPATNSLGTAMPLHDRAVNVLECLLGTPELAEAPVIFVCHSLGGLLVKQMLLDLHRRRARHPEAAALLERVRAVIFLATPHAGSRQAGWMERLRFLAWPSPVARTLVANDPGLRAINRDYRGLAEERRDHLRHLIFYETLDTPAGRIVDETSSDPGLPGRPPIPIDADHIGIAKPVDRSSVLYVRTRDLLWEILGRQELPETGFTAYDLPELKQQLSRNIVPTLFRLMLLTVVGVIGFKGVQALIVPSPPPDSSHLAREVEETKQTAEETNALIRQLFAHITVPVAPGAEQAVGEAVTAAVQGAAAGDERLRKALDLLSENRIAEAAELFRAVAVDREARIRQDRGDAAAAYRNLGAIAGLADPKAALDAYRKALEFDADDIESLFWVAQLQLEKGGRSEAEAGFRHVLTLAATEDRVWYRYGATLGLGDSHVERGNLADALTAYRDGLAIAERLAQADPGHAGWQRDLSVSYERIGDVLVAQGNLADALTAYRDGLAIRERLAQADPGHAGWQRDLAVSYSRLGIVFQKTGDEADALSALRRGQAIMVRMTQVSPDNVQWKRDLVWFDAQIANLTR